MIPYFTLTQIHLGPVTLHVWGLMVALGILAALGILRRTTRILHIPSAPFEESAFWILFCAFIGARIGHFAFYASPEKLMEFFKIWEGGWSSMGGMIGGGIAGAYQVLRGNLRHQAHAADVLLAGFPLGMAIGRIGCFLIHDHPGTLSHSLLAVQFPGGARHDLALYESIAMFGIALVLWINAPKLLKQGQGYLAAVVAGSYALIRFPLDFLRATDLATSDTRYLGLTMAQYGCLAIIAGVITYFTKKRHLRS